MEKYKIENGELTKNKSIKMGFYCEKVYKKHVDSYGEFGAGNIWENIRPTFNMALEQYEDEKKRNNMLLVGKVQSGKTSNLEMFTALALDNGYNMVIIYGGYDNTLLSQTIERFTETFDINDTDDSEMSPDIFSSDECALLAEDNEIIEEILISENPIFIICMKRPNAMNKVNELLKRIDKTELKAFIIDDEGDQASLNTKKNKESDASATYDSICKMKDHLGDPLYLSVTATPQALVLLDNFSRLIPDSIHVINPGEGYCGADAYHFDDDLIEIIDEKDQKELSKGNFANSLREAIMHFIISSAIIHDRGCTKTQMIVHSHRNTSVHSIIFRMVEAYIKTLKLMVKYKDLETLKTSKKEFEEVYTKMFKEEVISQYEFDKVWDIIIEDIIKNVFPIIKNATAKKMQMREKRGKHKIYIGGDLLQRGVTFPKLLTTYFLRWAKSGGNMDTNLQRARWFGYREKYIDICKIFTTSEISREFTYLSEMETDLWEQFRAIEEGEMEIDEILIEATDTRQNPTRKIVASYKKHAFKSWLRQKFGIFDVNQVENNNQLIEELLDNSSFDDTTNGRKDSGKTAEYAWIEKEKLIDLIDNIQGIFDMGPFERKSLKGLIGSDEKIPVIVMKDDEKDVRKRSFYQDNKIYALMQGADNPDPEKQIYQGDKHVLIDDKKVNIQIHKILPMKRNENGDKKELEEYIQYMFAIYVPEEKIFIVRG